MLAACGNSARGATAEELYSAVGVRQELEKAHALPVAWIVLAKPLIQLSLGVWLVVVS